MTGREYLLVSEKHIHKASERINTLAKIAPFKLPLFMEAMLEIKLSVSTVPSKRYLISGRTGVNCPMMKMLAWNTNGELSILTVT